MSLERGSPETLWALAVLMSVIVVAYWRVIAAVLVIAGASFTIVGLVTVVRAFRG